MFLVLGNGDRTDDCVSPFGADLTVDGKCDPLAWGEAWQVEDPYESTT